jgi:hypothetical protein
MYHLTWTDLIPSSVLEPERRCQAALSTTMPCLIFREIVSSGRKIIGFDVNETSNANGGEWNANVAATTCFINSAHFRYLSQKLVQIITAS